MYYDNFDRYDEEYNFLVLVILTDKIYSVFTGHIVWYIVNNHAHLRVLHHIDISIV